MLTKLEKNNCSFKSSAPNEIFDATEDSFYMKTRASKVNSNKCIIVRFDDTKTLDFNEGDCGETRRIICQTKPYSSFLTCDRNLRFLELFNLLANPSQDQTKTNKIMKKKLLYNDMMNRLHHDKAYDSLMSTLWYATLPCFDVKNVTADQSFGDYNEDPSAVLKYCEWKGVPIPCSTIFTSFPTDQGICCSFNIKAANEIYKYQRYSKKITDLQSADAAASVTNSTIPEWYIRQREPTSLPGRGQGLFLMLDAHSNFLSRTTLHNDFDGFTGLIHSKESFPLMSFKGFQIKPGYNSIALTPTRIEADDSLRDLDVNDRKCMFKDDKHDLQIHKDYSYFNCIFECSLQFASEEVILLNIILFHFFFETLNFFPITAFCKLAILLKFEGNLLFIFKLVLSLLSKIFLLSYRLAANIIRLTLAFLGFFQPRVMAVPGFAVHGNQ